MNIIILPILLGVGLYFILFLARRLSPRLNRLMSWKNNLLLAGVYLTLLLLILPIAALLLNDELIQSRESSRNLIVVSSPKDLADLHAYRIPLEGNLDEHPEIYKNSSHKFKLDTNKLAFANYSNSWYNQIYIERKDKDDSEVEVSTYTAPHFIGYFDFTRLVLPPSISMENGTLSIQAPSQQNLEFKRFNADFTVNQFRQVNQISHGINSTYLGWKAVYIRVPKNVEIVNSGEYNVQLVE